MRPSPLDVVTFLASEMPGYASQVGSPYLRKQLATGAMVLSMLAQDLDRLVPRLLEEAQAIRTIFHDARNVVTDAALAGKIGLEAESKSDDLSLSALEAENDRLRELLTVLHAHVESLANERAQILNQSIWDELIRQTERRRTSFLKL